MATLSEPGRTAEARRRSFVLPLIAGAGVAALLVLVYRTLLRVNPSHPLGVLFAGIVLVVGVLAFLGATSTDSRWGRRRTAKRLFGAAEVVRSPKGEEDAKHAMYVLKYTARFGRRFGSCYAVSLLGDLASESSSDQSLIRAIAECLQRDDPFVRHAAAAALYHLGTRASAARDQLARAAELFPDESSGELAKRTISSLPQSGLNL